MKPSMIYSLLSALCTLCVAFGAADAATQPFSKYGQIQNVQDYSSNPFWTPSSPQSACCNQFDVAQSDWCFGIGICASANNIKYKPDACGQCIAEYGTGCRHAWADNPWPPVCYQQPNQKQWPQVCIWDYSTTQVCNRYFPCTPQCHG